MRALNEHNIWNFEQTATYFVNEQSIIQPVWVTVVSGVQWKKVVVKTSQNSQENNCVKVYFFNATPATATWIR